MVCEPCSSPPSCLTLRLYSPLPHMSHSCPSPSSQVAVEVTRIMHDAVDALFEMGVPLPPDTVEALLRAFDASLNK